MDKLRDYYDKIRPYLTRPNLEKAALVLVLLCALWVFLSGRQTKAVLTLQDGAMRYEGQVVRQKPSGQGEITFENGDVYKGGFSGGTFEGEGSFTSAAGWSYEGEFKQGLADGSGKLTTETGAVYQGQFKKGVYQDAD